MKPEFIEVYKTAVDLVLTLDSSFLDLGRILRKAREEEKELYNSLMRLPGLDPRTAYYLINIDRVFGPLGLDKTELASIGWTKLSSIANHVTEENVHALLGLAKSHTDRQLKAMMTGKKALKKTRVVQLYLSTKQYAMYAAAVVKFGAKKTGKGLADQEPALMKILKKVL